MTKREEENKTRIKEISNVMELVFSKSQGIKKEELISQFMFAFGCSRRKILEYIDATHATLKFKEDEGEYWNV